MAHMRTNKRSIRESGENCYTFTLQGKTEGRVYVEGKVSEVFEDRGEVVIEKPEGGRVYRNMIKAYNGICEALNEYTEESQDIYFEDAAEYLIEHVDPDELYNVKYFEKYLKRLVREINELIDEWNAELDPSSDGEVDLFFDNIELKIGG